MSKLIGREFDSLKIVYMHKMSAAKGKYRPQRWLFFFPIRNSISRAVEKKVKDE